jgi:hypothetical protein
MFQNGYSEKKRENDEGRGGGSNRIGKSKKNKRLEAEEVERKPSKDMFRLQERQMEEEHNIRAIAKQKEAERLKKCLPEIGSLQK